MPHEKINYPRNPNEYPLADEEQWVDEAWARQLVVAWNKIGWVQVSIFPAGWNDTGDAWIIDVNPQELDLLIRTLQKAKKQAYSGTNRYSGFEDIPGVLESESLWSERVLG